MLRKSRWPVVQWQDTGLWSLEWRFESSPASQNFFAAHDKARASMPSIVAPSGCRVVEAGQIDPLRNRPYHAVTIETYTDFAMQRWDSSVAVPIFLSRALSPRAASAAFSHTE